ncbi:MAG: hypothetical protein EP330_30155 [Deltaproteobacteria bacterium]|nr:MAG: hypothetical protein EP330_30155 [Deltaproteobacteria bacterium]
MAPPLSRSLGIAGALLGFRAVLLFLGATANHWLPLEYNRIAATVNNPRSVPDEPDFWFQLTSWDVEHYMTLATDGYVAGDPSTAFYPLWPALMQAGAVVLGDPLLSGMILANLLFFGAVALLHHWACSRMDTDAADRFVLLLAMFPGNVFLTLAYSESLWLFLSAALFVAIDRKHWLAVAGLAFLLPLTKAVGLVALVPLGWAALHANDKKAWLAPVASVVGFAATLGLMQLRTGSAWTGFEAQKLYINNASALAVFDIPRFVRAMLAVDGVHSVTGSAIDRLCFLVWLAVLVPLWLRDKTLFLWTAAIGWVGVSGVNFMSFTRFLGVLFPVFLVASQALEPETPESPRTTYAFVVGLMTVLQAIFLFRFLAHWWVG